MTVFGVPATLLLDATLRNTHDPMLALAMVAGLGLGLIFWLLAWVIEHLDDGDDV